MLVRKYNIVFHQKKFQSFYFNCLKVLLINFRFFVLFSYSVFYKSYCFLIIKFA